MRVAARACARAACTLRPPRTRCAFFAARRVSAARRASSSEAPTLPRGGGAGGVRGSRGGGGGGGGVRRAGVGVAPGGLAHFAVATRRAGGGAVGCDGHSGAFGVAGCAASCRGRLLHFHGGGGSAASAASSTACRYDRLLISLSLFGNASPPTHDIARALSISQ